MPYGKVNRKYLMKVNPDTLIGLACLFLLAVISSIVVFSAIPDTLAAKVTMEVYQQADGKVFGKETKLDVFSKDNHYLNGEKLLAPYSAGSYIFAVYNSAASGLLPYALNISAANPEDIPMVFSLQKNGEYICGGAKDSEMVPLTEIDFADLQLSGRKTDLYTLHWRWNTHSDEEDTALGVLANERDLIYTLTIKATGTIDEASLPETGAKTGDTSNVLVWIVILGISLTLIFWLIFVRHRKKDKDNEIMHENR